LQLERHANAAFHRLLARHGHPEEYGEADRQQLQAEMFEWPNLDHSSSKCGV
jgi:hypothetical protein